MSSKLAWALLLTAAFIIGIAKSGFGGGIGILAVPLVGNVLEADHTVGVMLPVLISADLLAIAQHRKHRSDRHLRPALGGACIGILLAAAMVAWVAMAWPHDSETPGSSTNRLQTLLAISVGGVTLAMVVLQAYRWSGGRLRRLPDTPTAGAVAGGLAGFVSAIAHAAGPVMTLYWLESRLDKRSLVATLVVFFFAVNVMKVPFYVLGGLMHPATLWVSAGMLLAVPLGSLVGLWLHRRVAEGPFTVVMYVAAAAAGLRMLWLAWVG